MNDEVKEFNKKKYVTHSFLLHRMYSLLHYFQFAKGNIPTLHLHNVLHFL